MGVSVYNVTTVQWTTAQTCHGNPGSEITCWYPGYFTLTGLITRYNKTAIAATTKEKTELNILEQKQILPKDK